MNALWLGKKNRESRVRGVLQRDDVPAWVVQMPCGRAAREAGPRLPACAQFGPSLEQHLLERALVIEVFPTQPRER